jgi:hypothetical protein
LASEIVIILVSHMALAAAEKDTARLFLGHIAILI